MNLTVSALDQAIRLSRPALSFTAVAAAEWFRPGNFAVNNIGRGTMDFTVSTRTLSGGQQWLAATPTRAPTAARRRQRHGDGESDWPRPRVLLRAGTRGFPRRANTPQMATIALRVLPRVRIRGRYPAERAGLHRGSRRSAAGIEESVRVQRFGHAANLHFEFHGLRRER